MSSTINTNSSMKDDIPNVKNIVHCLILYFRFFIVYLTGFLKLNAEPSLILSLENNILIIALTIKNCIGTEY